jgi:UDP-glucose 4-epimerase
MTEQRVLITGAGGFVCSNIVQVLLDAGCNVIAVDQAFDEARRLTWESHYPDQIELIETSADQIPAREVDALIHGAAITASPDEAGQTPEANFRANLEPTLALLDYAQQQKVHWALFISSSAVYSQTAPGPVSEEQPPVPLGLYAVAKHTTETLLTSLHDLYGRNVAALRLSNIYGPFERSRPTRPRTSLAGQMVQEALETGQLSVHENTVARDWTYAPDIGRAIVRLLEQPTLKHALYNIAAEQVLTRLDIAQAIQTHLPDVRLQMVAGDDPDVKHLTRRGYLSHQRLQQDTDFDEWTPFAEGIRQVIAEQQTPEITA